MFYVAGGIRYEVEIQDQEGPTPRFAAGATLAVQRIRGAGVSDAVAKAVASSKALRSRVGALSPVAIIKPVKAPRAAAALPTTRASAAYLTQTLIVEGARSADLAVAQEEGALIVEEGLDGKVLLGADSAQHVFALVELLTARGVGAVAPNFVRRMVRPQAAPIQRAWALAKIRVAQAWKITRGAADVRIAILDEGVDTGHVALKDAVVAERDFIGDNGASAMPDGDDAHGTACAGIAVSRDDVYRGVAPRCSLIAARIGIGDGAGGWVFDDFSTAEAVDWSWREGAAVLSNSWGGGPPSDLISRALGRARTQGRHGLGAVVVIAAGNDQAPIDFPGSLAGYVTIGASNSRDERKTRTSSDGERWWGSNYGPTLHVVAPGVFIRTTDISGARGYEVGHYTDAFNGTSAATPHVAGAAALMISANPSITASAVRDLLAKSAKRLAGQTGWTQELGWGRLDVAAAVQAAARAKRRGTRKNARKKRGKNATQTKRTSGRRAPRARVRESARKSPRR
ncbi:MAG: hypothetical protein DCC71_04180 [Proteobacteria bacterium]|nr:MAG: hypothetical protein DCC71_04180 [Pseudomonadota bacterium]